MSYKTKRNSDLVGDMINMSGELAGILRQTSIEDQYRHYNFKSGSDIQRKKYMNRDPSFLRCYELSQHTKDIDGHQSRIYNTTA